MFCHSSTIVLLCLLSVFFFFFFCCFYGTTWHTPTAVDFAELYGSAVVDGNPSGAKRLGAFVLGSFTPVSGYAFGPGRNDVILSGNNRVTNADPRINGALFVPASGYRAEWNPAGAVYNIGSEGQSWSSTTSTPANGHYLQFNSTNIRPQRSDFRSFGFPVRCIRD